MNENRKELITTIHAELLQKKYNELRGELDYNDLLRRGEIKSDEIKPISVSEYAFKCGQCSILEWVLAMARLITEEDNNAETKED